MISINTTFIVFVTILHIFIIVSVFLRINSLPNLLVILKLALKIVPPSKTYKCFDYIEIEKPKLSNPYKNNYTKIDLSISWNKSNTISFEDFLIKTHTKAFIFIKDNTIIYEKYFGGAKSDTIFPANSLSKVFLSTLVGIALDKNLLKLEDNIGKYLDKKIIGPDCSDITVYELLNGKSRLNVPEKYSGLWGPIVKMYLTTDLNKFLKGVRRVKAPTSSFAYQSVDAQLLSKVLEIAFGCTLPESFEKYVWKPLGSECKATWSIDSKKNGEVKAFSGLNATARDFAKLGSLYLNNGMSGNERVISSDWALQPLVSAEYDYVRNMGYKNNWWKPFSDENTECFSSIGIFGQYIFVDPKNRTIIVKLSEHGIEDDLIQTFSAFKKLSYANIPLPT